MRDAWEGLDLGDDLGQPVPVVCLCPGDHVIGSRHDLRFQDARHCPDQLSDEGYPGELGLDENVYILHVTRPRSRFIPPAPPLLSLCSAPSQLPPGPNVTRLVGLLSLPGAARRKSATSRSTTPGRTCASLLVALDVHPRVAMQILRHNRITVTMDISSEVHPPGQGGRGGPPRRRSRAAVAVSVAAIPVVVFLDAAGVSYLVLRGRNGTLPGAAGTPSGHTSASASTAGSPATARSPGAAARQGRPDQGSVQPRLLAT
jgi:hypothetical protein